MITNKDGDILGFSSSPYQFSCWNRSDPNFKKLSQVNSEDTVFDMCLRLAEDVQSNRLPDNTLGSTYYHHITVSPYWAKGKQPVVTKYPLAFYILD